MKRSTNGCGHRPVCAEPTEYFYLCQNSCMEHGSQTSKRSGLGRSDQERTSAVGSVIRNHARVAAASYFAGLAPL